MVSAIGSRKCDAERRRFGYACLSYSRPVAHDDAVRRVTAILFAAEAAAHHEIRHPHSAKLNDLFFSFKTGAVNSISGLHPVGSSSSTESSSSKYQPGR